jgi:hypothetical protein
MGPKAVSFNRIAEMDGQEVMDFQNHQPDQAETKQASGVRIRGLLKPEH